MIRTTILVLIALFISTSHGEGLKLKRSKEVFQLTNVSYFIANPRYLCKGNSAYDTTNAMHKDLSAEIESKLKKKNVSGWSPVSDDAGRKMTIGFNRSADRKTGKVDSLPYTTWEYCTGNNIDTFVAFYLYQENPYKDIQDGREVDIRIPIQITNAFGVIDPRILTIRITVDLSNVQLCLAVYDVASNRCRFFKRTDDEDYVSLGEIADELFQKLR